MSRQAYDLHLNIATQARSEPLIELTVDSEIVKAVRKSKAGKAQV